MKINFYFFFVSNFFSTRGFAVALLGCTAPFFIAFGLAHAIGLDGKAAIAVGCCLAPSSMGMAIQVLKAANLLNSPTGQLVIAAAMLADVIALVSTE
jgi:Kef-type K+ transport system membrane component KefB